ncbi:hypothetical protein J6590_027167 [Homalodisca vitripennis]|nr:hypothetical protein J6590_027167 [Homalodisca vitripennis]
MLEELRTVISAAQRNVWRVVDCHLGCSEEFGELWTDISAAQRNVWRVVDRHIGCSEECLEKLRTAISAIQRNVWRVVDRHLGCSEEFGELWTDILAAQRNEGCRLTSRLLRGVWRLVDRRIGCSEECLESCGLTSRLLRGIFRELWTDISAAQRNGYLESRGLTSWLLRGMFGELWTDISAAQRNVWRVVDRHIGCSEECLESCGLTSWLLRGMFGDLGMFQELCTVISVARGMLGGLWLTSRLLRGVWRLVDRRIGCSEECLESCGLTSWLLRGMFRELWTDISAAQRNEYLESRGLTSWLLRGMFGELWTVISAAQRNNWREFGDLWTDVSAAQRNVWRLVDRRIGCSEECLESCGQSYWLLRGMLRELWTDISAAQRNVKRLMDRNIDCSEEYLESRGLTSWLLRGMFGELWTVISAAQRNVWRVVDSLDNCKVGDKKDQNEPLHRFDIRCTIDDVSDTISKHAGPTDLAYWIEGRCRMHEDFRRSKFKRSTTLQKQGRSQRYLLNSTAIIIHFSFLKTYITVNLLSSSFLIIYWCDLHFKTGFCIGLALVGGGASDGILLNSTPGCEDWDRVVAGKSSVSSGAGTGSLLAGLYLPVEPTTGHSKNRCATSIWATLWMSSSGTSLTANVEILGFMGNSIVGGVCSLTSEALVNLNKGVPTPAYFDWRGWFRAGLPFFRDDFEMRWHLLPNLTHPEYPITPEAAQSFFVLELSKEHYSRFQESSPPLGYPQIAAHSTPTSAAARRPHL